MLAPTPRTLSLEAMFIYNAPAARSVDAAVRSYFNKLCRDLPDLQRE